MAVCVRDAVTFLFEKLFWLFARKIHAVTDNTFGDI